MYDESKLKGFLKIPDKLDVHAVIAFGYPDAKPEMPLRVALNNVVSFNEYGNPRRDPFPLVKK